MSKLLEIAAICLKKSEQNLPQVEDNVFRHSMKLERIKKQVRGWIKIEMMKVMEVKGKPSTSGVGVFDRSKYDEIKIEMKDIIQIDFRKQIVRTEPGVAFSTLFYKLLDLGWTLPVIPKDISLTLGECVNQHVDSVDAETQESVKFTKACVDYEIVTRDAIWINCNKEANSYYYYSIPWSGQNVGILTGITVAMIPATKSFKMEHYRIRNICEI